MGSELPDAQHGMRQADYNDAAFYQNNDYGTASSLDGAASSQNLAPTPISPTPPTLPPSQPPPTPPMIRGGMQGAQQAIPVVAGGPAPAAMHVPQPAPYDMMQMAWNLMQQAQATQAMWMWDSPYAWSDAPGDWGTHTTATETTPGVVIGSVPSGDAAQQRAPPYDSVPEWNWNRPRCRTWQGRASGLGRLRRWQRAGSVMGQGKGSLAKG